MSDNPSFTPRSVVDNWPHNWFGVWRHKGDEVGGFPTLDDLIDRQWDHPNLDDLLAYLRECPIATCAGMPSTNCSICGEDVGDPSCLMTDGVWMWPSRLPHDVTAHGVRLPDRLIDHIIKASFSPPSNVETAPEDLPWPDA